MGKLRKIILALSVLLFFVCILALGIYFWNAGAEQRLFEQLSENRPSFSPVTPVEELPERPDAAEASTMKPSESPDYVGWVKIADTKVDYPVMQNKQYPEFYLRRDFYGKYSQSGTPFLDASCDLFNPQDSRIIYGHNTKSGILFTDLMQYHAADFWRKHPTITLETAEGTAEYEIFAALRSDTGTDSFGLLQNVHVTTEDARRQFLDNLAQNALYSTGITPQVTDSLLFLVTCTNSYEDDGRMIVAARGVDAPENAAE